MKKNIIKFVFILSIFLLICSILFNLNKDNNKKIKVAEVTHSIFYAPLYVAINNGYFKDYNIDIELVLTPGADKVIAAVLSNDADIGLSGIEATIYVYNQNEKDYLKTFAQLTQKDGSFIISRKKINNFNIKDLIGKYIIGGRKAGMPEMTLEYVLKQNNINIIKDLTIDTSISFQNASSAFISGTGDFVTLFEPNATEIEENGFGYIVASLGELGGIVPYTSFSARTSYINNNKETINNFTKAIQKGIDYVLNNENEKIAYILKESFPDTNIETLIKVLERYKNQNTWPKNTEFSEESFNHLQEIMIEADELDEKVNYKDLILINE